MMILETFALIIIASFVTLAIVGLAEVGSLLAHTLTKHSRKFALPIHSNSAEASQAR